MRFILFLALISLTGCESMPWYSDSFSSEEDSKATQSWAEKERLARVRNFKNNLHPGQTMSEVKAALGEPKETEFSKDQTIHWYDGKKPFWLTYNSSGILEGKTFDRAMVIERKRQSDESATQMAVGLTNAAATMSKALSGGAAINTDFVCFNKCTNAGSQYDFCHSKCDY